MPYIGKSPEMGVRTRYYYTVSAGATGVSGNDDNSKSLTFSDGEYVDVYLNGVSLVAGTDYNTTTANTIAGLSAMSANDVVEVVVYDVFSVFSGDISGDLAVGGTVTVNSIIQTTTSDGDMVLKGNDGGSTITALTLDMSDAGKAIFNAGATFSSQVLVTTADNSAQLNLTSTDTDANNGPRLALQRDSGSPADDDILGNIEWYGENDASEAIEMGLIQVAVRDVSDGTEDSALSIHTKVGGSRLNRCAFEPSKTLFNGNSADIDFVVESNDDANMFFVNAGSNVVLVGHDTSVDSDGVVADFQNHSTTHGAISTHRYSANASAPQIIIGKSRSGSLGGNTVLQDGDYCGILGFHGNDGNGFHEAGQIAVIVQSGVGNNDIPADMVFQTNSGGTGTTERMRIKALGTVSMNNNAPDINGLQVYSKDASFTGQVLSLEANRNTSNGTYKFLGCHRVGNSTVFNIFDDGDVTNSNNSYGSTSDEKLKENIADASSQWDDIKALKVRKFSFKTDKKSSADKLGVIAQEVEAAGMNGLVTEIVDEVRDENQFLEDGETENPNYWQVTGKAETTTKQVKYSILYMKAVKALQEAMTRIETLETKVKALEDA